MSSIRNKYIHGMNHPTCAGGSRGDGGGVDGGASAASSRPGHRGCEQA